MGLAFLRGCSGSGYAYRVDVERAAASRILVAAMVSLFSCEAVVSGSYRR
jgi:hypothetical protein